VGGGVGHVYDLVSAPPDDLTGGVCHYRSGRYFAIGGGFSGFLKGFTHETYF
jgi:hypothetical protein